MLFKLDRDGNDRLSSETVFPDVLHGHCKGWKTYTLSYYESILREMIRLARMECPFENHKCCKLFFKTINRMMAEYAKDVGRFQDVTFNPFHLKDDKNGANKIGMRAVSGEMFVNERTSSCEFHIDKNVTKRKSHIVKESQEYYFSLLQKLKNAPSINDFEKNLFKTLITQQIPGNRNSLRETLQFWLKAKHRWTVCYRSSLHGIPLSSLAETAQASMKAAGGKNVSLIDVVYASVTDSVRLEAKIQNREIGEVVRGTGPSESEVQKRRERRQILHAEQMVERQAISGEDLLFNDTIFDVTCSHRPDKRHRSLNYFQHIGKMETINRNKTIQ